MRAEEEGELQIDPQKVVVGVRIPVRRAQAQATKPAAATTRTTLSELAQRIGALEAEVTELKERLKV